MSVFLLHPGNATLIDFDAGELKQTHQARVARHLRACVRCQESLRFIRKLAATANEIDEPVADDALLAGILDARAAGERVLLPSTAAFHTNARGAVRRVIASLAAAAVIAVVLTLALRPEGLSAASGRLMHNLMHRVAPLSALVDAKHADSIARRVPKPASNVIAVYSMEDVEAESSERLKSISTVKVFSDGRVLVHDVSGHALRLFDSTLSSSALIAGEDSGQFKYGKQASILIPYWGDSALFLDNASNAFLVLDANGSIQRTIALPAGSDWLGLLSGAPVLDPRGRLYYRVPIVPADASPNPRLRLYAKDVDSCVIVRADFDTRTIDTVAVVASGGVTRAPMMLPSGRLILHATINPAPVHDDWTILADGTVAIVRGSDYHVDWVRPDGTRASSGKLPFDWRKLDDDAKRRLLDSAQAATEASVLRTRPTATKEDMREQFELVAIDKLPDYFPAVRIGSRRADLDGNVWIPPTTTRYATGGGLLYDAVNRQGTIVQRVMLKPGYAVAGFGPGGSVYMVGTDSTGLRIARARVSRTPRNH